MGAQGDLAMKYRLNAAFTLVEIMIVMLVIALLAAIAIPAFVRARKSSQNTRFMNDLRITKDAFELMATLQGTYPADVNEGTEPAGIHEYLPKLDWAASTSIGGLWDWDYEQFSIRAGVSVHQPDRTDSDMRAIDSRIDDGNLLSGIFRKRTDGYIYIIEE